MITLLGVCKSPSERFLVLFLAQTGLRVSEACALTLEDIDVEKGVLTVQKGKGGKRRVLGMGALLVEALRGYLAERPQTCRHSFLFWDQVGMPATRFGLTKRLERLGKKAGFSVTPHALRRAFVTINANKRRPLQMLQMACDHSDIKTTMGYCQTQEQEVIEAMKGWD